MRQIEKFNNQINSMRLYPFENRAFQQSVDMIIKKVISNLNSTNKACVIAAGNLSDFSVLEMTKEFDSVVLTDVDVISMKRALSFQSLSRQQYRKIKLIKVEYTGFDEDDSLASFKERFVNCLSKQKIEQVLTHIFESVKEYTFLTEEEQSFDLIYISPIYSQLLYHQISDLVDQLIHSGYPIHLGKYIKEVVLKEMPKLIERFNSNIIKLLSDSGSIIVVSDVFELQNSSGFYRRVKNSIKNQEVMDEIYEGYKKKYGMGLGDYGIYDIEKSLQKSLSRWEIWPKDEENSYIVKIEVLKK